MDRKNLYERDFYAWIQQQAQFLRDRAWEKLDLPNLIEEIESLGRQQRQELRNRLAVLVGHLLKWEYQPEGRSASWLLTLQVQRQEVLELLEENPSLKPYLPEAISKSYLGALKLALEETKLPRKIFPKTCPYSSEQILDSRFYPGEPSSLLEENYDRISDNPKSKETTMTVTQQNSTPSAQQGRDPRIKEIDALTLKQWLDQGRVQLIDVREPGEYADERIPGAINLPLSTFDPAKVPASTPEKPVVLQCRMGSRSIRAGCQLLDHGWPEVISLKGGIEAWKAAKLPVTRTQNAPISIMRQVQIAAGSLVLTGTLLGAFVNPWWLLLSGFVGAGLVFAGITNTCGMALLLARMPWNRGQSL